MDTQPGPLSQDQKLGVEEPARIRDVRQQLPRDIGADGLETALGVAESSSQCGLEQQHVTPRDNLPLRAADYPG